MFLAKLIAVDALDKKVCTASPLLTVRLGLFHKVENALAKLKGILTDGEHSHGIACHGLRNGSSSGDTTLDQGLDLIGFNSRHVLSNVLDFSEGPGKESRLTGLFLNLLSSSGGDSGPFTTSAGTALALAPASGWASASSSAFGCASASSSAFGCASASSSAFGWASASSSAFGWASASASASGRATAPFDEHFRDSLVVSESKRVSKLVLLQDSHGVAGRGQATHDESDPHCLDKVLKLYSDSILMKYQ